jgi:hypothetical protein
VGCDKPAWTADIDHTVPYPLGPTHPSNNVCYCRLHHLLKTFSSWKERQLPDGTVEFTSPSGRVYSTEPFGAMLFPQLGVSTEELALANGPPPGPNRELAMPKRKRTRAQERAYRIQQERNINAARYAADPPPFQGGNRAEVLRLWQLRFTYLGRATIQVEASGVRNAVRRMAVVVAFIGVFAAGATVPANAQPIDPAIGVNGLIDTLRLLTGQTS